MSLSPERKILTSTHWGIYELHIENSALVAVKPWAEDPEPSPIGQSLPGAIDGPVRIARPLIRKGWLDKTSREATPRGRDAFIEVSWDEALGIVAAELDRVRQQYGNQAIYAGSYGWASAGRFHHAQSQIHRFLNLIGGYTSSENTYSSAAGEVVLPYIIGNQYGLVSHYTTWEQIASHGELVLAFGGLPGRNSQIQGGGVGRHLHNASLQRAVEQGVRFINLSPCRDDMPENIPSEWLPLRPTTDSALLLALCFELIQQQRYDKAFIERCTVGFEQISAYLRGDNDGIVKDAAWAAAICQIPEVKIRELADLIASHRTMVMVNWAIQRAEFGEQPYWAAVTLAALSGDIGLPGGGFGFGYACLNGVGQNELGYRWPSLPQGKNPVAESIPVARLADMLLAPGDEYDFNGMTRRYPDIRLVYWAGGNPFHHHQDLNRLVKAWQQPETIIVQEPFWNATARHGDIILPVTTSFERNDIALVNRDNTIVAMKKALPAFREARDDYHIFQSIAQQLGIEENFTLGRTAEEWVEDLYEQSRKRNPLLPPFDQFWQEEVVTFAQPASHYNLLEDFRADPARCPLMTASGRIELYSQSVADYGYTECPGHAVWREPEEWLGSPLARTYPIHLLSPQPADKLHSQYDHGKVSQSAKIHGRNRLLMHPLDAQHRGIVAGDVVRIFNSRGQCLAGVKLSDAMMPGVAQLPTGAWFDPSYQDGECLDKQGNPNVLTQDKGSSRLSQGPSCNSLLVEIERYISRLPEITAFTPPQILRRCQNVKE
ncbi:Trimethylamine-N-oxide reductase (Cytochrome c) [Pantoea sp. AS-PWVM4]|uniref:molybdopterin-dependent oxidoreductase n=1 Tax=Pantoea sp. AS-PWVM4 TaxID=1332069 RepID=UPI0003AC9698|nr:molybdopterin-dependent oxidoreductase [Pantoea sp. AS-PWVM4]ERK16252.1 Trimethylamine-N-oxide reductase (Cytochrome c) [Pantoea sp. AS-PWVM4]